MKNKVDSIDISNIHLVRILKCLMGRERSINASRIWGKRGFDKIGYQKLESYWKERAKNDKGLSERIALLYLEFEENNKKGGIFIDCTRNANKTLVKDTEETKSKLKLSVSKKLVSISRSAFNWVKSGAKTVTEEKFNKRKSICDSCEKWDSSGFHGTGKCTICGCSTWAKLKMDTEKCPIGKWD
jgi:hypothetical protein